MRTEDCRNCHPNPDFAARGSSTDVFVRPSIAAWDETVNLVRFAAAANFAIFTSLGTATFQPLSAVRAPTNSQQPNSQQPLTLRWWRSMVPFDSAPESVVSASVEDTNHGCKWSSPTALDF
jgi:hypothetical protein